MKLDKKSLNLLDSYDGTMAVIFGRLQKTKGAVSLTNVNKILKSLHFDRIKRKDFEMVAKEIESHKELGKLSQLAMDDSLRLDDLKMSDGSYRSKSLETDLDSVLSPSQRIHQRVLDNTREYRTATRTEARYQNMMEDVFQELNKSIEKSDIAVNLPDVVINDNQDKSLLVTASDYHIGNSYSIKGNRFNFEILKKRVHTYTEQAIAYGKQLGITDLYFVHLGDLIEGINMRATNQAYFDEFTYSEQVSNGIKLLVWQLQQFTKYFHVTFGVVEGNHDRIDGNKKSSVYSDGAMVIVLNQIKLLAENGAFNNLDIMDNLDDIYNLEFDVGGKHIYCTHGETIKRNSTDNIAKHTRDKKIDLLIGGHYHNFMAREENNASMVAIAGSMKGYDMYSKTLNLGDSVASQLMVTIDKDSLDLKTVWL